MEIANRSVYRGQITKLSKLASDFLDSAKVTSDRIDELDGIEEDLVVFLQRITAALDNLKKADEEYRNRSKVEDLERELETAAEYHDKAISVIARLNQRILQIHRYQNRINGQSGAVSQPGRKDTESNAKLPKLQLKSFSGSLINWLPFWEQYKIAIHENGKLSASDKFQYLQSLLHGKAGETISGFTPTQRCYDAAISLLQEQYGNTDKVIDQHMQQLLSLRSVTSQRDAPSLRKLYSSVVSVTRSLTVLGVPCNQYSVMLKPVLLNCLPIELKTEYYRQYVENGSDSVCSDNTEESERSDSVLDMSSSCSSEKHVQSILKFLKKEVEALENSGSNQKVKHNNTASSVKTAASLIATNSSNPCFFCKTNSHLSEACDSALTVTQRKDMLKSDGRCFKCTKRGHSARSCRNNKLRCAKCSRNHATSLCDPNFKSNPEVNTNATTNLHSNSSSSAVYLQTACVLASCPDSVSHLPCRIILDGGSQRTYIKRSLSRKLKLPIVAKKSLRISTFGETTVGPKCQYNVVKLCLKSQYDARHIVLCAIEMESICADCLEPPTDNVPGTFNLLLADKPIATQNASPKQVDLLIGSDNYWKIVSGEIIRLTESLTAVNTLFGWTIQGPTAAHSIADDVCLLSLTEPANCNQFDETFFWNLELLGITANTNNSAAHINFQDFVEKHELRYVAKLLWSDPNVSINSNQHGAMLRFKHLIRRLSKDPDMFREYDAAMAQMLRNGIAEKVIDSHPPPSRVFYLPHRAVYREDKLTTKLRIVFDGSACTEQGGSLNDALSTGPNLLTDVLATLINFRLGEIGVIADIEKAFHQILLHPCDRDVHRFYWFSHSVDNIDVLPPLQEFRMCRVTFGIKCSPFLLGAAIKQQLKLYEASYPRTCDVLGYSFYMDDLVFSADDLTTGRQIVTESIDIFANASMHLTKWASCNAALMSAFPECDKTAFIRKVLGIVWFLKTDELAVDLSSAMNFCEASNIGTKRNVLQMIARIFDPLGFLNPYTVKLKLLFQTTWKLALDWDQLLPDDLQKEWANCVEDIHELEELVFPRWAMGLARYDFQIHFFADASPKAFGVAVYARSQDEGGSINSKLLLSKSRIAPIKKKRKNTVNNGNDEDDLKLTLPKLELTACLLAARLVNYLRNNTKLALNNVYFWSDSKIALAWINSKDVYQLDPYVSGRVSEIQKYTSVQQWRHSPGRENPADLLTRGISGRHLKSSERWFTGPTWIRESEENWPDSASVELTIAANIMVRQEDIPEIEVAEPIFELTRYSSLHKILRITAYIMRFTKMNNNSNKLSDEEIEKAEIYWIRHIQSTTYRKEIAALLAGRCVPQGSSLQEFSPILDEKRILRLGSRLQFMQRSNDENYDYDICPIILPRTTYLAKLIIEDIHKLKYHGGSNIVLTELRKKYWIPRSRQLIKSIIRNCVICKRLRGKSMSPPFAPLPRCRLNATRAFQNTGLDFAGPLHVKLSPTDEGTSKVYILLFTCAVVRAAHLEVVRSLTTEDFLLALRRFIARRGTPDVIMSDNAKTFKAAIPEINAFNNIFKSESFTGFISSLRIKWNFIVERAPWWGGFWERLMRVIKDALRAAVGREILQLNKFETLLAEIENVINSRPLSYVSEDPLDLSPLTPNHFLSSILPDTSRENSNEVDVASLQRKWKDRLKQLMLFWKRWKDEYLKQLRSAHRCPTGFPYCLKEGDIVLVYDQSAPRVLWKIAMVETVFPGRDGKVRACEVRFGNGSRLRRPVQLLYPMELSNETKPSPGAEDVKK